MIFSSSPESWQGPPMSCCHYTNCPPLTGSSLSLHWYSLEVFKTFPVSYHHQKEHKIWPLADNGDTPIWQASQVGVLDITSITSSSKYLLIKLSGLQDNINITSPPSRFIFILRQPFINFPLYLVDTVFDHELIKPKILRAIQFYFS